MTQTHYFPGEKQMRCICGCKKGLCGGPVCGESSYCVHCQQGMCHRADGPVTVSCQGCGKAISVSADAAFFEGEDCHRCDFCWDQHEFHDAELRLENMQFDVTACHAEQLEKQREQWGEAAWLYAQKWLEVYVETEARIVGKVV
jgi:hypothetical protein